MQTLSLPPALAKPVVISGKVASKVMLDLTVYLRGPSERELDYLIDLYESICPPDRLAKYKIAELEFWPRIARPVLTISGRAAEAAGIKHPYFEPARERIRQGRAFEVQFWDGREIDDPDGSWSFNCRSIHKRSKGLFAFARILVPLTTDLEILHKAASTIADNIELYSGHGGLVLVYNTWLIEDAFDNIYAQARRFWGVDVEYMNRTLPLMKEDIKGVNWITLVGQQFASAPEIRQALGFLVMRPEVTIEPCQHGSVLIAGPEPVIGDQHRPDRSLDPYYAVANALRPLFLTHHPDFPGERFIKNGNTVGWIRRFIEPNGWR
jgi:hypothetical protein